MSLKLIGNKATLPNTSGMRHANLNANHWLLATTAGDDSEVDFQ